MAQHFNNGRSLKEDNGKNSILILSTSSTEKVTLACLDYISLYRFYQKRSILNHP
jgi:hypothetical protein